MSVCPFTSLPNGDYSNLFNSVAFFNKSFSSKTSFRVKNSFLLTFPDDKAEMLAVCLSFVLRDFVIDCFNFLTNSHFIISSS